jgi:hypothetical protein
VTLPGGVESVHGGAAWLAQAPGAFELEPGLWAVPAAHPWRGALRAVWTLAWRGEAQLPSRAALEAALLRAREAGALAVVLECAREGAERVVRAAGLERVGAVLVAEGLPRLPAAPFEHAALDEAACALAAAAGSMAALAAHPDPADLHWRFGTAARARGSFAVRDGDGGLQGLAIAAPRGGHLEVDCWWAQEPAEGAESVAPLLGGALGAAARAAGLELRVELPLWHPALGVLLEAGLRLAPSGRSRWVASLAPRLDLEVLRNRWLRQRGDGLGPLGAGVEADQGPRPAVGQAEDDAVESTPPRS